NIERHVPEALFPGLRDLGEKAAEDALGVGRPDRLEAWRVTEGELLTETAAMCDQPITAAARTTEGLRVGIADRAPRRDSDVHDEHRRGEMVPRFDELAADTSMQRHRLLQDRRARLPARVIADTPTIRRFAIRVEAAKIEGRRELPFE